MSSEWRKEIFKQKSLWQVYRLSRQTIPRGRGNRVVFLTCLSLLAPLSAWIAWKGPRYFSLNETAEWVLLLADTGFVFSIGILGFLIAGFSIFASITKPELFIALAQIPYKDGKINRLQFVFFNFLNVFSVYLALLAASVVVQLFFSQPSPVTLLGQYIMSKYPVLGFATNGIAFAGFALLFVDAFLRLKSFIWNLYQTVLVSIATEHEMSERDRTQE